jgi:thiamine biosynthesis protein ThiI
MNKEHVVVARYGELWLKGKNRPEFERALVSNVKQALGPITKCKVERSTGVLVIRPESRHGDVARRLTEVFGFSSISPALAVSHDVEQITATAAEVMQRAMEGMPPKGKITFRVSTKRADKRFPLTSVELDVHVANNILAPYEERVVIKLKKPDLDLGIYIRPEAVYVFCERLPGAGGLPVGTLGRVVSLLSGGIDSPVASHQAMKRGCEVVYASFHSYPFIGESYMAKIRRLVRSLARFQPHSVLYQVPFSEIQVAIRDNTPHSYRTVLYRRMMQRISSDIADREKALALVTGESIGQVASQTLENMSCIGAASRHPVIRPLVTFDKTETIAIAERIGTFELSIEPEPDCCTVFQPKRPIIRGKLAICLDAETSIDVDGLVQAAMQGSVREVIE